MIKYLPFTGKTRMADVIHMDFRLIPIIGRFGIDFGFEDKTIAEVCLKYNVNEIFFLEIINSYHNPHYISDNKTQYIDCQLVVQYLSETHNYYLNKKVPEIAQVIDEMEKKVLEKNRNNIKLLKNFFNEYINELKKHLKNEEKLIFPYTKMLRDALFSNIYDKQLMLKIESDPLKKYDPEHDSLKLKLSDLKNLIIRYLPPVLCKESCQRLLIMLFHLESDLSNHYKIEDKVLIPRIRGLEKKILELNDNK